MKSFYILAIILLCEIPYHLAKSNNKNVVVDNIMDIKEFKKIIRTKTNVLVCFTNSVKQFAPVIKVFKEAASIIKGQGTMILIDCSGEAKKMCKKLKVTSESYVLKHYKDGEFNKDYDRRETVTSMVNFMRDPTGDLPWEEDVSANDVVHIADAANLAKLIKKESKPIMIMFYAPWCGFCKSLKPEYAVAANELQGHSILAAIDVNRPENAIIRTQYNITGFPTLLYYLHGAMKYQYEGENTKTGIINFMKNPQAPPIKLKEPEWSDVDSEVVHLTSSSFDPVIKEESSVLVMFYAPWCGHCKRMKPEYEKAAAAMKNEATLGMLAAVDATKEQGVASKFAIKGYPTVKYFSYGDFKFDVNVREASKIVEFMKNPHEPPPPPPPEIPWSEEKTAVVHLTEENFKPFLKKKKNVLVMFYTPWCGHCKKAKPEFAKAAQAFEDDTKVEFAAVDCTTQQALCNANDVKGYPTIKYFSYYSKATKSYVGGRTSEDFVYFMKDPESTQPPKRGSSKVPPPLSSNIVIVNDGNFKDVIASAAPTLVMFSAPWCTHCDQMKPDFNQAADELKQERFQATLAYMDTPDSIETAEEYEIAGFPVLKLFRRGGFIIDYKGNRKAADLKSFIKKYGGRDEL